MANSTIKSTKHKATHLGSLGQSGEQNPYTGDITLSKPYSDYDYLYICSAYYGSGQANYGGCLIPTTINLTEYTSFETEHGSVRVLLHDGNKVNVLTNPAKLPVVVYGVGG